MRHIATFEVIQIPRMKEKLPKRRFLFPQTHSAKDCYHLVSR